MAIPPDHFLTQSVQMAGMTSSISTSTVKWLCPQRQRPVNVCTAYPYDRVYIKRKASPESDGFCIQTTTKLELVVPSDQQQIDVVGRHFSRFGEVAVVQQADFVINEGGHVLLK